MPSPLVRAILFLSCVVAAKSRAAASCRLPDTAGLTDAADGDWGHRHRLPTRTVVAARDNPFNRLDWGVWLARLGRTICCPLGRARWASQAIVRSSNFSRRGRVQSRGLAQDVVVRFGLRPLHLAIVEDIVDIRAGRCGRPCAARGHAVDGASTRAEWQAPGLCGAAGSGAGGSRRSWLIERAFVIESSGPWQPVASGSESLPFARHGMRDRRCVQVKSGMSPG